jgi:uncharacterized protein (TIGR03067 family)
MDRRSFLAGAAAFALTGFVQAAAKGNPPSPDIERLIKQLGSNKFREREAASRALARAGGPALAALRTAATDNPDAEVRRRAVRLVGTIDARCRQGTWEIVRLEYHGQVRGFLAKLPKDDREFVFTPDGIEGFLWIMRHCTCQVDAIPTPQTIDMRFYSRSWGDELRLFRTYPGIYRFDQGELLLCFDTAYYPHRPTQFKTEKGSQVVLYRMRRQKSHP